MQVVTGAFGYIGRYVAQRLLDSGEAVRTITTHPNKPNPFGNKVEAFPYNFEYPDELVTALRGASTLYNTYWIRFEHGGATFEQAVENTVTLFEGAMWAGKAPQIINTHYRGLVERPRRIPRLHHLVILARRDATMA